jgi:hypothetical protein
MPGSISDIRNTLSNHKIAIFLAIVTSLTVALPQIYFRIDHLNDGVNKGIELLPDSPWSPRVREVQDGYPSLGSIYYKDGKDDPYLFQPLGSIVVGYLGKIFLLDINNTLLLSRIVLTFIVFLLIYSFTFFLSKDKQVSLCGAAVVILAEPILTPFGITQILQGLSPYEFLPISKPVNHAMIHVLLFSFLGSFWIFYKEKKWLFGIISGIILGLNFYNYFYSWTYFVVSFY